MATAGSEQIGGCSEGHGGGGASRRPIGAASRRARLSGDRGQKFGDDQAGKHAALLAYYGLFSLFPLLLVVATLLAYALANNPTLQRQLIDTVIDHSPGSARSCKSIKTISASSGQVIRHRLSRARDRELNHAITGSRCDNALRWRGGLLAARKRGVGGIP